jgi:hemoglobin
MLPVCGTVIDAGCLAVVATLGEKPDRHSGDRCFGDECDAGEVFEKEWTMKTLYEHAGGEEALHRVEELFYSKVLTDPILSKLFTERRPHHVDHLTWFTAESLGGPDRFTREVGFRHIIDVHRHLNITDEQRERFVALYLESIDEAGLPDDEPFREAVRSHLEFGSRVAQQNSWAETEADLHPIREVPRWKWPEKK